MRNMRVNVFTGSPFELNPKNFRIKLKM